MRLIWLILGCLCVIAAVVGVFLPILPTVPFLLLAAFLFGKSSKTAHDWLLSHKAFGPAIRDWRENGAISRKSKTLSAASIVVVFAISVFSAVPVLILIIQVVILSAVSVFIWTRPNS